MLTDALIQFPGTIAFISMTPRFSCASPHASWKLMKARPAITSGDYEYYCWKRAKELEDQIPPKPNSTRKNRRKKRNPTKTNPPLSTSSMGMPRQLSCPLPLHRDEIFQKASPAWKNKWPPRKKTSPHLKNRSKTETSNWLPRTPTRITPAATPSINTERSGLAILIASPSNGATSAPNSINNRPKFHNYPYRVAFLQLAKAERERS